MKTHSIGIIAIAAMLSAHIAGATETGPLTESAVRQFMARRDTLMVQGDVDQIGTLFDTNATVIIGLAANPEAEYEMSILQYLESFSRPERPACVSHQTITKQISISKKGKQASVEAKVRTGGEMGKRKRLVTQDTSETLTLEQRDGGLKIFSLKQMICGQSLATDAFSERIVSMIQENDAIGQEKATELIEELGGEYKEQEAKDGRILGVIRLREYTACGDEVLALATQFSAVENLSLMLHSGIGVTDKGLELIEHQQNLLGLWVGSSQITDAGLAYLAGHTNLTGLQITSTPITDAGLIHLENLKKLRVLVLMGTRVSGEGIKQLRSKLPSLQMVVHESLIDPCKESRRSIDYAKRKWAKEQGRKGGELPSEADLKPYLRRRFSSLKCQDSGTFSINPIGDPASCSIHGKIEPRKKRPPLAGLSKEDFDTEGAKVGRWTMDLDAAVKLAADKQFPILLNFTGSDWCHWCKLMEKNVFIQPEWSGYATNHIVMVLIDFPRDKSAVPEKYKERNNTLKEQYEIRGLPTFVLLKPDGQTELGRLKAGRNKTPASFIAEVKALLNTWGYAETLTSMYAPDTAVISVNFTTRAEIEQIDPSTAAGMGGYTNWNNTILTHGKIDSLKDSNGNITGASIAWAAYNTWRDGAAHALATEGIGDAQLAIGYLDDGRADMNRPPNSLTVTGIGFEKYDVILYLSTDVDGDVYGPFSINGANYSTKGSKHTYTHPNWNASNTIKASGLTGDLTVRGRQRLSPGDPIRASIAGLQIIEVEAPANAAPEVHAKGKSAAERVETKGHRK